jgi:hypothetical protein
VIRATHHTTSVGSVHIVLYAWNHLAIETLGSVLQARSTERKDNLHPQEIGSLGEAGAIANDSCVWLGVWLKWHSTRP